MGNNRQINRIDMVECMLCHDAQCSQKCDKFNLSSVLQSIWLDNINGARLAIKDEQNPCSSCKDKPCIRACPKHLNIANIIEKLFSHKVDFALKDDDDERLKSNICGIEIENPFLLSSSVVGSSYDMCSRAFDAGWAGVCYKTICDFPIKETSPRFAAISDSMNTIYGFKNIEQLSDHSLSENLETFKKLKRNYPHKFLMVSIMGRHEDEWIKLAKLCEDSGADALELNFSCPNMVEKKTGSEMGIDKSLIEKYTAVVKNSVKIPVLSKLTPNITNISEIALAAIKAGADGISAINTIKSLMNVSNENIRLSVGGYSGKAVKPIALRQISEISRLEEFKNKHISGMGGVETWKDSLDFLLLGAKSIQVTTAVMQYGYKIIDDLKMGLKIYLSKNDTNIDKICSLALNRLKENDALPRDIIIYPKFDRKSCMGCLRCYVSCRDGGHQAISYDEDRKPILDAKKCVGCHLCVYVCPTLSISSSNVEVKKK